MLNITDEREFLSRCEVARGVIDCAGSHEQIDGVKWFFKECRGDQDHRYQIIFRSWHKPRYEGFMLAVEAVRQEGQGTWEIDVVKKVICGS